MSSLDRRCFTLGAAAAPWIAAPAWAQPAAAFPPDAAVRQILVERVDVQTRSIGLAVGLVSPQERRVVSHGRLDTTDPRQPNGDTVFMIGSLSKVFTAWLAADMARRGEISLDDPAQALLPDLPLPKPPGRPISLADLATHTSGLPFGPPVVAGQAQSVEAVRQLLAGLSLDSPAGTQWQYSNLGSGLLGHALARRAGMPYETLLRQRITGPLGMTSTAVRPTRAMRARLAPGHDVELKPVVVQATRGVDLFAPAGGLYSTVNDLMALVAATLGQGPAAVVATAALMPATRRPAPQIRGQQALGWEVYGRGEGEFLSKEGSVYGYNAAMACDPKAGRGVVALSNVESDVADIAKHLLRPAIPLSKAYKAVAVPVELLDRYAGPYRGPTTTLVFDREGAALWVKIPGVVRAPLIAIGPAEFAQPQIGIEFTFQLGASGPAEAVAIRRPGQPEAIGRRVPAAP